MISSAASSLVTTPITHNTAFDTRDYSDKQQDDLLHTVGTDDVESHNDILALSRRSFVGQSR